MADNPLTRLAGLFASNKTPGLNAGNTPPVRTDKEPGPPNQGTPYGGSGRANMFGLPQWDETNQKLIGEQGQYLFDAMYRQDPDIRRLVLMVAAPVQAGSWSLEPYGGDDASDQDKEIADTIWWGLNNYMRPNFQQHLGEALPLLIRAGFAPFEQLWGTTDYKGKTLTLPKSLQVRLPRSIWKWPQDDYGNLAAIVQMIPTRGNVTIAAKDLTYYRIGGEGDNWMGVSMLRGAYKPWVYKDKLERIDAIGQERKAVGVPIIYPPSGADPQTKQQVEQLFASMHLSEAAYAMMPGPRQGTNIDPNLGWEVDVIQFNSSSGESIQASLTYHKLAISGSVLGDFMELGHHQVGAKATAQVQMDPFLTAVDAFSHIGPLPPLNDLVDKIRQLNWPDADGSPTFTVNLTDSASLEEIATYASTLITAGAMQVDPELEDWLRERADLPPANADVRAQQDQINKAKQQAELDGAQNPTGPNGANYQPPGMPPQGGMPQPGGTKQFDTPSAKWWENLLSQGQLKEALDGARDSVEHAARPAATQLAAEIASRHGDGTHPHTGPLVDALQGEYERLYRVGHQTARDEIAKHRKVLMTPGDVAAAAGARLARARQRATQSAENIAHEISKRIAQASITGLKDPTELASAASQAATRQIHMEALDNASAMVNDGRFDAAQQNGAVGAYYTSVLDGNTCDECESADTGDLLTLDDAEALGPPNPDCAGGDRCRCMLVYITDQDPTAP